MGSHCAALQEYTKVLELKAPPFPLDPMRSHELAAVGRWEEAIAVLRAASAREPGNLDFLYQEGKIFRSLGKLEEAAEAFRKAATKGLNFAWKDLAAARLDQGRFAEARAAVLEMLKVGARAEERQAQRRQLELCDALLAIDADLPAILAGHKRPTEIATQHALAEWCWKHKRLPATAARLYTLVLARQPSLADNLEAGTRFHAACAAALLGCGVSENAGQLDAQRQAEWRQQALDWLLAEHDAWAQRHRLGTPQDQTHAATTVRSWLQSADLAGVRDEPALTKLPADERRDWQALWAKVRALASRDPAALFAQARAYFGRKEWGKAARCFAEAMALGPTEDGDLWFEYAAVQLLAHDRAGYRKACAHMLARCQPQGPMRPYLVARACTLADDSTDDPERPLLLTCKELTLHQGEFWAQTGSAASHFRVKLPKAAAGFAARSLVADGRPARAVLNWLWLALAYQEMGNVKEARRWLDKAANWLDQQGGRMPVNANYSGSHPHNWLEAHVLRQEAEALLR
jgi:tetratricopeptide (TPR) repeat protein